MSTENNFLAEKMNRRDFLALSALGVLPCMLSRLPGWDTDLE